MEKVNLISRRLSPYLLPLILSGALLIVFWMCLFRRDSFQHQLASSAWEQEAREALALLRTTHTLESQVDAMGFRMVPHISRFAASRPKAGLKADDFVSSFRRNLPKSHRPEGSRLYVFSYGDDGEVKLVEGPGTANRGGRVMTELFKTFAEISK